METLPDRLGHLLQATDPGGLCLFAPEEESRACKGAAVSHLVDVSQVFLHERCGPEIFELKAQQLEFLDRFSGEILFVAQQQEALVLNSFFCSYSRLFIVLRRSLSMRSFISFMTWK